MKFKDTAAAALLPPGFAAIMEKIEAKHRKPAKKRRGVLAAVEQALALGQTPPRLEFVSTANYTYNRHASRLHEYWLARETEMLEAYPITGKNTYARALARYRELLLAHPRKDA